MELKDKLRRLTKPQLEILNYLVEKTTASSNATGAIANRSGMELGGVLSGLSKNGLIEPAGREGAVLNWRITEEIESNKEAVQEVIRKILEL